MWDYDLICGSCLPLPLKGWKGWLQNDQIGYFGWDCFLNLGFLF